MRSRPPALFGNLSAAIVSISNEGTGAYSSGAIGLRSIYNIHPVKKQNIQDSAGKKEAIAA